MKKYLKLRYLFLVLLLWLVLRASLNYSGFCWAEKRWLSDEELIMNALDQAKIENIIQESPKDFLLKNSKCCSIPKIAGDSFVPPNFYLQLSGKHLKNVEIHLNESKSLYPYMSNCGNAKFGYWH
jgi:hypothetical protein